MIPFSCADYTFPTLTRMQALQLLQLLEFDFVDIGLFARSAHFSPAHLGEAGDLFLKQVQQELSATGLCVSDVFLQIGLDPSRCAVNDPDPSVRAQGRITFNHALEFCAALNCHHLTGLPGVFQAGCSAENDTALAADETGWRVDRCAASGIEYAIEPHLGSICPDVESTLSFLARVSRLTLSLDYGHFIYAGTASGEVDRLLPAASHIHVRGGAPGRLQTSVDDNTIDFHGMLRQLKRLSYQGLLALEYVWVDWQGCNRTDNLAETTRLRRELQLAMQQLDQERELHV